MFQEDSLDIADLIDNIKQCTSPQELLGYLFQIPWDNVFTLFVPVNFQNRHSVVTESPPLLLSLIKKEEENYNVQISGKRAAALTSYNTNFINGLKFSVINFLEVRGIEYIKAKEERDKTVDSLKTTLQSHLNKGTVKPSLYMMEINEVPELIDIKLQYTQLGALIMWNAEIPHDLSSLDAQTLSLINDRIRKHTRGLSDMYEVAGKPVKYTENTASELCLYMLNRTFVPRCVQINGKTELQIGHREVGHGIFPSIYNKSKVLLTSDANNTGNVEFSQVLRDSLYNINGKIAPFLNMDAGSAPTQIGFQESMGARDKLYEGNSVKKLNKPVQITVYSPTGIPMLQIQSDAEFTGYTVNIYNDDGSATHAGNITNLSITNVIEIVNTVPDLFKFNASLLKSLGDLLPYLIVCLLISLESDEMNTTNVMGSIDYSMIFQLLGNVRYIKDGHDKTAALNQLTILTGVNMENTNTYFPWSAYEKRVYRTLLYMYSGVDNDIIQNYKKVKQEIYNLIMGYTAQHKLTQNVSDYLAHICIDNLVACEKALKDGNFPDSPKLIEDLNIILQKLPTLDLDDISIFEHDEEDELPDVSVEIDDLDYVLAKRISLKKEEDIPVSPPLMLPIRTNDQTAKPKPKPKQKPIKSSRPTMALSTKSGALSTKSGTPYYKSKKGNGTTNKKGRKLGGKCRKTIRKR